MATLESIQAKIQTLQRQAESLIAKQASGVIEKIRNLMAEHGLTTADINTQGGGKRSSTKLAGKAVSKSSVDVAKYRDPKTGATWTGHGRAPNWIATAKNRDKFLFDASVASAKSASVNKKKAAGNYVRGPQLTKYLDPKTGATWSGRGRAPAWLAAAKDRSRFLIAGAGADAGSADAVSTKVARKKASAKKGAAKKAVATEPAAKKAAAKKALTAKTAGRKVTVKATQKPAGKKVPTKKTSPKSTAVTAPSAVVETGVGSTT